MKMVELNLRLAKALGFPVDEAKLEEQKRDFEQRLVANEKRLADARARRSERLAKRNAKRAKKSRCFEGWFG